MTEIRKYTEQRNPDVNAYFLSKEAKEISKHIDQESIEFDTLYRGIPADWDFVDSIEVGKNIKLAYSNGFVSTSKDFFVAKRFSGEFNEGQNQRVVFEIKGAKGVEIVNSKYSGEKEVLLQRKTAGTISDFYRKGNVWVITVNV